MSLLLLVFFFFFKQKTAYERRISDWSSDVCSSDLAEPLPETVALDETYQRITRDSPFVSGISALYAYESQVPDVADTKMDGLKRFYGINDKQAKIGRATCRERVCQYV